MSIPADVDILDAKPSDAEAILALQKLAYESEARRYQNWSIPPLVETLDAVRRHIEDHTVLKAVDGAAIVGSVRGVVTGGVCEVGRLIVHPGRQRRGIGSALLDAIEARVAGDGVSAFELFTGDRSVENLRLYERHGYRRFKTEAVSPAVSLVFLRKPTPC
jgi:ribosomal protein S18 acetylase RimI-like enzyme